MNSDKNKLLWVDKLKPDLIINEIFINEFEEINLTEMDRMKSIGFAGEKSQRLQYFGYSQTFLQYQNWIRKHFAALAREYNYKKSLIYLYEKSSIYYSDTVINKLDNFVREINNIANLNNTKLLLMYVPGQIEISPPDSISYYPVHLNLKDTNTYDFDISHSIIKSVCEKYYVNLLDTKDVLSDYPHQPVYFKESWHWNNAGHELISNVLTIKINKLIDDEYK